MLRKTCSPEEFLKAWNVGDWNAVRVRCTGGRYPLVETWINDLHVCAWDAKTSEHPKYDKEQVADTLGAAGHVAVQVHGGKGAWPAGAKCRWRAIRIKPLS